MVTLDGTGATFTPGVNYRYLIGQAAGAQSLSITSDSQFQFTGVTPAPGSVSFTGTATGTYT